MPFAFIKPAAPRCSAGEEVDVGDPGPREVRVRQIAVGLNFADTYFRSGLYPVQLPAGIGVEGSAWWRPSALE